MNLILLETNRDSYYFERPITLYVNNGSHNFGPPIKTGDYRFYCGYHWISNGFYYFGDHGFYISK